MVKFFPKKKDNIFFRFLFQLELIYIFNVFN